MTYFLIAFLLTQSGIQAQVISMHSTLEGCAIAHMAAEHRNKLELAENPQLRISCLQLVGTT